MRPGRGGRQPLALLLRLLLLGLAWAGEGGDPAEVEIRTDVELLEALAGSATTITVVKPVRFGAAWRQQEQRQRYVQVTRNVVIRSRGDSVHDSVGHGGQRTPFVYWSRGAPMQPMELRTADVRAGLHTPHPGQLPPHH